MKYYLAAFLLIAVSLGCSTLTPQQQTNIQAAERILAVATQVAAPMVSDKRLSDALYGVGALSQAYSGQPIPVNVVQATAQIAPVAGVVIPYVSSKNDAKTQAVINGAAAILAATHSP